MEVFKIWVRPRVYMRVRALRVQQMLYDGIAPLKKSLGLLTFFLNFFSLSQANYNWQSLSITLYFSNLRHYCCNFGIYSLCNFQITRLQYSLYIYQHQQDRYIVQFVIFCNFINFPPLQCTDLLNQCNDNQECAEFRSIQIKIWEFSSSSQFLIFKHYLVTVTNRDWPRMTETDGAWPRLTETDWDWLWLTETGPKK